MDEGGGEGEKVKQEVERERKEFVEQLTSTAAKESTVSHPCLPLVANTPLTLYRHHRPQPLALVLL